MTSDHLGTFSRNPAEKWSNRNPVRRSNRSKIGRNPGRFNHPERSNLSLNHANLVKVDHRGSLTEGQRKDRIGDRQEKSIRETNSMSV